MGWKCTKINVSWVADKNSENVKLQIVKYNNV